MHMYNRFLNLASKQKISAKIKKSSQIKKKLWTFSLHNYLLQIPGNIFSFPFLQQFKLPFYISMVFLFSTRTWVSLSRYGPFCKMKLSEQEIGKSHTHANAHTHTHTHTQTHTHTHTYKYIHRRIHTRTDRQRETGRIRQMNS